MMAPPRRRPTRKTASPASPSACRDVVWVDSRPLRDRARRDYEKARKDLVKAQGQLELYENQDRPQFQQWLTVHFGRHLTQLRELGAKILEAEELIMAVEAEAFLTDCSYERAYQRIMHRRSEPETRGPRSGKKKADQAETFSDPDPDSDEADDEFFREFFEQARAHQEPKAAAAARASSRVKELYRALVRLLHPDKNKNLTAQQREWWHQAQAAYQNGDEAQLELILTLCELERPSQELRHTTLSLLRLLVDRVKSSLRELRRKLKRCQEDPAWGFSALRNHELLHHRVQRQFEEELFALRETYQFSQARINAWKRRSPRKRSKPEWWP